MEHLLQWLTNVRRCTTHQLQRGSELSGHGNFECGIYGNLTDAFGDVPMTEASRAEEGILKPSFNTQKEVYTKILNDLETANELFDPSRPLIYGTEILFNNNVQNWRRFANSLRMRLLLRVSKREEMNSWVLLREMIDNPALHPVFAANDRGAVMKIPGITPNVSPWGRAIDFTTFRAAGKFFLIILTTSTIHDFQVCYAGKNSMAQLQ